MERLPRHQGPLRPVAELHNKRDCAVNLLTPFDRIVTPDVVDELCSKLKTSTTNYSDLLSNVDVPKTFNVKDMFNKSTKIAEGETACGDFSGNMELDWFSQFCSKNRSANPFPDGMNDNLWEESDNFNIDSCVSVLNDDNGRMAFYDPLVTPMEASPSDAFAFFGKGSKATNCKGDNLTENQFKQKMQQMNQEHQDMMMEERQRDAERLDAYLRSME